MHIDLFNALLHAPFRSTCQRFGMFLPGVIWFLLNGHLFNMFKMAHTMRGKLYSQFCVIGGCNIEAYSTQCVVEAWIIHAWLEVGDIVHLECVRIKAISVLCHCTRHLNT